MIKIDLKLFVTLSKYGEKMGPGYEVPEGTSVDKLISDLGIPDDLVKLIFVNGKKKDGAYILQPGDRVGLFPPVGGG